MRMPLLPRRRRIGIVRLCISRLLIPAISFTCVLIVYAASGGGDGGGALPPVRQYDTFEEAARAIAADGRVVATTVVNDAFVPLTFNWLCNTKDMGVHESVVLVATDREAFAKLRRHWPRVASVLLDLGDDMRRTHLFGDVGYEKLMIKRTEFINAALQADDARVLLFETDALWLRNPIAELARGSNAYDILVALNRPNGEIAGNFLYFRPTPKTKLFWAEKTRLMTSQLAGFVGKRSDDRTPENDQKYVTKLLAARYADVLVAVWPLERVQTGRWYTRQTVRAKPTLPDVINNNFVRGIAAKETRAKRWRHWFLRDDGVTCDGAQVERILTLGPRADEPPDEPPWP
ncbi:PREDICTED: uncharacterized protein LOC106809018 [Priapulus caudatus]|uniref:Uncharacterized protein LOC106809018 n=1 Tax=Priapulus caudatus TaxID=37621 RepID=A0ABM1E5H7_PRICU|nr:PREDICTED: uncharacterized protein LOC106809018 [Priapulus caudatus]